MTLREIVARNLRNLRRAKGLSQEELAHRAELNRNYVGKLERCENSATVDVLERLAGVLVIDPIRFMDRSFVQVDRGSTSAMALPDRQEPLAQD